MGRVSVPPYWTPDGALVFVRLLSCVLLFAAPWTAALQASLSFTISQRLHKRMSIELVMPSNHLILCHPLLLPSVFPSIRVFASGGQSIGASTSASVLPMNIQGWFPLGLTDLSSVLSKGLPSLTILNPRGLHCSATFIFFPFRWFRPDISRTLFYILLPVLSPPPLFISQI